MMKFNGNAGGPRFINMIQHILYACNKSSKKTKESMFLLNGFPPAGRNNSFYGPTCYEKYKAIDSKPVNPTEKPFWIQMALVLHFLDGPVIDATGGSGSLAMVLVALGRTGIIFEKDKRQCEPSKPASTKPKIQAFSPTPPD